MPGNIESLPKDESGNVRPGPGRPKGSKNRYTQLKEAFLDAFEGIGGTEELIGWAQETKNRAKFYELLIRILPKPVEEPDEQAMRSHEEWLAKIAEEMKDPTSQGAFRAYEQQYAGIKRVEGLLGFSIYGGGDAQEAAGEEY